MATLEKAEELEQRVMVNASERGTEMLARLSAQTSRWILSGSWEMGTSGAAMLARTFAESAQQMRERVLARTQADPTSEVSLEEFSELTGGRREVVSIEDSEVLEEVRAELEKHGVTFAIERGEDDEHYLHVRGDDAQLIAHALDRAQERLDRHRTQDAPQQTPTAEFDAAQDKARSHALSVAEQVSKAQGVELTKDQIDQLTVNELRAQGFSPDGSRLDAESREDDRSERQPADARSAEEAEMERREEAYLNERRAEIPDRTEQPRAEGRAARGDSRERRDSRERSKATIREKIGALADRLRGREGTSAPTLELNAHKERKGPRR